MIGHLQAARHGAMGLPLAFVAMPLYVILPQHYAQTLGVSLSALGMVLLFTRLADAFVDPWIGRQADAALDRPRRRHALAVLAALGLSAGFALLFFPQVAGEAALLAWCAASLVLCFLCYSLASVLHLAWGTRLGGNVAQRARVVAWREGFGLFGVLLANGVATQLGLAWTTALLWSALVLGVWAWLTGPRPPSRADAAPVPEGQHDLWRPWRSAGFRRLMLLFMVNGTASAIPATLVLFFIHDRLQLPEAVPLFLGGYFLMAALSVPWWVRCVGRFGPLRAWAMGMALALLSFLGVHWFGAGDQTAYLLVCLVGGWALGADLTAPGTLLTGVVQRTGDAGVAEGSYAGWWQWATKLNLALAAGLALPALELLGYTPGARTPEALQALTLAYGALPCAFKALALFACWRWRQHPALH